ncbi:IPExxxVDY family protein [Aquimarina sp. BL5]|uniref:IPExxxVDY family protein n=1 Tax=Aquimarina sp. BL5 TaxID=1714860 RepID=UPI000E4C87EB|nr:IPExxxVDY family protein [Aquimarina sp. BL5]AXT52063.1 IPExxxVDY family protein [Aquimarina sp. BL5]RKN11175.1 IPExxxVDY family protein [Aquimarina sp. BL5]
MAIQRLVLDTIMDDDYDLIAIHCSLASYRLAFGLNKYVDLRLFRKKQDIKFEYDTHSASFPLFQYHDHFQYNTYSLLGNKFRTKIESETAAVQGLFAAEEEDNYVTKYLIPELKNVDYFLKIEAETSQFSSKSLTSKLLTIPQIITAYVVDYTQLKSKNNLIFE